MPLRSSWRSTWSPPCGFDRPCPGFRSFRGRGPRARSPVQAGLFREFPLNEAPRRSSRSGCPRAVGLQAAHPVSRTATAVALDFEALILAEIRESPWCYPPRDRFPLQFQLPPGAYLEPRWRGLLHSYPLMAFSLHPPRTEVTYEHLQRLARAQPGLSVTGRSNLLEVSSHHPKVASAHAPDDSSNRTARHEQLTRSNSRSEAKNAGGSQKVVDAICGYTCGFVNNSSRSFLCH